MSGSTVLDPGVERPPVDPRLRARRIAVRRREGRRRLRRLLALLALTLVCAGAWGIAHSPLLDVDHLEVVGTANADPAAVIAAGGISHGEPLVEVDLDGASDAISELPWVASVQASRSWGGTIRYSVVERRPVAVLVAGDGSRWLVDAEGHVLDLTDDPDVDLLAIRGVDPPEPGDVLASAPRRAVDTAAAIGPGLAPWVDSITLDRSGELWLELVTAPASPVELVDARVRLGDGRDLEVQLTDAETILARVQLECLAVVDARVASSPVVTRHPGCGAS